MMYIPPIKVLQDSVFVYIFTFTRAIYFHMCLCCCLAFQLGGLPLEVLARQVINPLTFCLSGKVFFIFKWWFCQIIVFLVGSFPPPALWIYHPTAFGPILFLLRNLLTVTCQFPCIWWITSLATFKVLFLSLTFDNLIIMCLWAYPVGCLLNFLNLAVHLLPQIWGVSGHCFFT